MPLGWITGRIQLGDIDYTMPKIAVCSILPVPLILGTDWQYAVQARCVFDPNGDLCIATPSSMQQYKCVRAGPASVNCILQNRHFFEPPTFKPPIKVLEVCDKTEVTVLSQNELGLSSENKKNCSRSRIYEIGRRGHDEAHKQSSAKKQVDQWIEQGICQPSRSDYAAPCFLVEQPFHETTPHRLVIDYAERSIQFLFRTLNLWTTWKI
jgi:hypothetical protein